MNIIDFAYEVLEMQERIVFLERELDHYKKMHKMNQESLARIDLNSRQSFAKTLDVLLDKNGFLSKGYAAIEAEKIGMTE